MSSPLSIQSPKPSSQPLLTRLTQGSSDGKNILGIVTSFLSPHDVGNILVLSKDLNFRNLVIESFRSSKLARINRLNLTLLHMSSESERKAKFQGLVEQGLKLQGLTINSQVANLQQSIEKLKESTNPSRNVLLSEQESKLREPIAKGVNFPQLIEQECMENLLTLKDKISSTLLFKLDALKRKYAFFDDALKGASAPANSKEIKIKKFQEELKDLLKELKDLLTKEIKKITDDHQGFAGFNSFRLQEAIKSAEPTLIMEEVIGEYYASVFEEVIKKHYISFELKMDLDVLFILESYPNQMVSIYKVIEKYGNRGFPFVEHLIKKMSSQEFNKIPARYFAPILECLLTNKRLTKAINFVNALRKKRTGCEQLLNLFGTELYENIIRIYADKRDVLGIVRAFEALSKHCDVTNLLFLSFPPAILEGNYQAISDILKIANIASLNRSDCLKVDFSETVCSILHYMNDSINQKMLKIIKFMGLVPQRKIQNLILTKALKVYQQRSQEERINKLEVDLNRENSASADLANFELLCSFFFDRFCEEKEPFIAFELFKAMTEKQKSEYVESLTKLCVEKEEYTLALQVIGQISTVE